jgi:hypothetical protein
MTKECMQHECGELYKQKVMSTVTAVENISESYFLKNKLPNVTH